MDLNMEILFDCKNNFGKNLPIIKERTKSTNHIDW